MRNEPTETAATHHESPQLRCPACDTHADWPHQRCPACGTGLLVVYPDLAARLSGATWPPRQDQPLEQRFAALLPHTPLAPTLGEGTVPLLRSARLSRAAGGAEVHLALEAVNPTGSFKDRGTVVAMSQALHRGVRAVGAVSTGNMATSVAAYARRAGIPAVIVVADSVPVGKLRAVAVYEPLLLRVERDHGQLYFDSVELGRELGIYFMNGDDPYRIEGQKTIVLDACAKLHPREPTVVVVPLSSGGNLLATVKGLRELVDGGLLRRMPKVVGVQPEGCAPIWSAFVEGRPAVRRVEQPRTIAGAIRNPFPPSGDQVLRALREADGTVVVAADRELVEQQRGLATQEGLWVQPDAAASVVGLQKLHAEGEIGPDDVVVCMLTGAGHRDPDTPPAPSQIPTVPFDAFAGELRDFVSSQA